MRSCFIIFFTICSSVVFGQNRDSLLKADIDAVVEVLEFMYEYDQTLREYTLYKTFDKSETNRIEGLPDSLKAKECANRKFYSDTLGRYIWDNYINPMDSLHTKYLIELTRKYGFLSTNRLKKYYTNEFSNPEFNPTIIFMHSPKIYWKEIDQLITQNLAEGYINRCTYGYIKWHIKGRTDLKYMLDNGFKLVKDETGRDVLRAVDCD